MEESDVDEDDYDSEDAEGNFAGKKEKKEDEVDFTQQKYKTQTPVAVKWEISEGKAYAVLLTYMVEVYTVDSDVPVQ